MARKHVASTEARSGAPHATPLSAPPRRQLEKDAEELELEERLFGTKKRKIDVGPTVDVDAESDEEGMDGVDDSMLFTVDAPEIAGADYDSDEDVSEDGDEEDEAVGAIGEIDYEADDVEGLSGDGSAESGSGSESESDTEPEDMSDSGDESDGDVEIGLPDDMYDLTDDMDASAGAKPLARRSVWHDPADEMVGVNMEEVRRLKKLARGKKGGKINGTELQSRLREQFERLHPRPEWADNRTRKGVPSLSSLFSTTKSFIDLPAAGSSRGALPQGTIEMQRQRNANQDNPTTGKRDAQGAGDGVVDFAWHPNARVPVGAVAGGDRRVRFFHIDGEANPTLLTLHIPSLPLTNITYHPTGSSLLLTGSRPFYYTYDLASQRCIRSPRNLFGSSPSPSSPLSLGRHAFSPDGSLLAVAGRRGAVSVLDWTGGNGGGATGAVVAELVSGRGGSTVDMLWGRDGRTLEVLGGRTGSEVEVWDVGQRAIRSKWTDERAFGGCRMIRSKEGEYTAIGSSTGIVNLYSTDSLEARSASASGQDAGLPVINPDPLRSLEHLTTRISAMSFHPSGEILVNASSDKQKLLKMYHLPSGTAFSNWPTQRTPLGRVTTTDFSPSGEYLTIGNQKGQVLLWSLNHFSR